MYRIVQCDAVLHSYGQQCRHSNSHIPVRVDMPVPVVSNPRKWIVIGSDRVS